MHSQVNWKISLQHPLGLLQAFLSRTNQEHLAYEAPRKHPGCPGVHMFESPQLVAFE